MAFFNNCFKNGMLPIEVSPEELEALMGDAEKGGNARLTVDLESQTITRPDGSAVHFEVDAFRKHCLLEGLDDIGLTLEHAGRIDDFEARQRSDQPWLHGAAAG